MSRNVVNVVSCYTLEEMMNELPEQIYASSMTCLTSKTVLYGEKYMVPLNYYSLWAIVGILLKPNNVWL